MSDTEATKRYYAGFREHEWNRLESPEGRIEFALTVDALAPLLPRAGRVLDLGGGPGRYTAWLRSVGLTPTLADLSPELLALAREHLAPGTAEQVVEADARDLSRWSPDRFAATIALGPFYHLTDPQDRRTALAEIMRVTEPGGIVAIALMPLYGFLRRTVSLPDEHHHLADPGFVEALMGSGRFVNDVDGRFTEGYGVSPGTVASEFEDAGLQTVEVLSTHGFATGLEVPLEAMRTEHPAAYATVFDLLRRTARDPSLLGTAGHILYVGRNGAGTGPRQAP